MKPFQTVIKKLETEVKALFQGNLDEQAVIPPIDLGGKDTFVVDWQGLTHLNSRGIAKWVKWVDDFETHNPGCKIVFKNCPQIVVNQMNTIKGFLPRRARVESFAVPFYSETTDQTEFVLYEENRHFYVEGDKVEFKHPVDLISAQTGEKLELDVVPEKYFAFFSRWK